ncbi:RWD domain-containing protein 1 isoform X2 [Acyrthosiphon pisum]|nr:RWD domain-containing protein 1 isoform X2 [Acyrthosiphon pisum]|eukprot:XP_008185983.1 PREDICTED: RWD domain-containing protein 1 isoform X2 [Acyrthosiphon pisum]
MDYKEEQQNEIDALDSIYCGEMIISGSDPYYQFEIPVKSDEFDSVQHDIGLSCCLKFEYVEKYPDDPPIVEIEDVVGFEEQEDELKEYLIQQAQDNVGMVMIFTLVSAAQEWMNNYSDSEKQRKIDDDDKRREKEMEAELKRFEGTKVTVESFLRWKFNFEEDMGVLKKRNEEEKNKKLTGRELFMTDKSLNESDLKFLEEGDSVKVDESLFEEIDDLDIGDAGSSDDS